MGVLIGLSGNAKKYPGKLNQCYIPKHHSVMQN
jgi:hypothetical protein